MFIMKFLLLTFLLLGAVFSTDIEETQSNSFVEVMPEQLQFPNIDKIINCIKVTVEQYPEVKQEFQEIFDLFKQKKYLDVLVKLAGLSGKAKDIYNQCKNGKAVTFFKFLKTGSKFPDISKIVNCIKAAAEDFPEIKKDFEAIITSFKKKNYLEVLTELAKLTGPAKDVYNKCKNNKLESENLVRSHVFKTNSFAFPDFSKIIECVKASVADVPEIEHDVEDIVTLYKEKKYIELLKKVASLAGPAKDIFNKCKQIFGEVVKTEANQALKAVGFPSIDQILRCVLEAAKKFPEVENDFIDIYNLAKKGDFIQVIRKLSSLNGVAKEIYNTCKA